MAKLEEHKVSPFVVIDFETGGLDKKKHALTEIAMYAIEGDSLQEIGRYESLIQPYGKEYDPKALQITGLSLEKLEREGKPFKEVCKEVEDFLNTANVYQSRTGYKPIIVAHNALFEVGCLQHLQNEGGVPIDKLLHGMIDYYGNFIPSVVDTMHLAKFLWAANSRQKKYTLEAVMERAGIPLIDAHRAMNDVLPSTDFLKWVIKLLRGAESGGITTSSGGENGENTSFRSNFHFQY